MLRKTSDSDEGGILLVSSMSTFEPPDLMKPYKVCQNLSIYAYKVTTSKISMYDGTKLYLQQVKTYSNDPGRSIQVKVVGFCSAFDRIGSEKT